MLKLTSPEWFKKAACTDKDPILWFPEDQGPNRGAEGKAICAGCPVQQECLEYAIDTKQEYGIWGGMSPAERKKHDQSDPG